MFPASEQSYHEPQDDSFVQAANAQPDRSLKRKDQEQYYDMNDFESVLVYKRQQKVRPRGGKKLWRWLAILILLLILAGGGNAVYWNVIKLSNTGAVNQQSEISSFSVGQHPTLVMNTVVGDIHIHTGVAGNVTLRKYIEQGDVEDKALPSDIQTKYIQSNDAVIISNSSEKGKRIDLDISVPDTGNIEIHCTVGNVTIDGFKGQVVARTESGFISSKNVTLMGQSSLKATRGAIEFDGVLDPQSSSHFETDSVIRIALPETATFSLQVLAGSSISNEFQNQSVGDGSHARLELAAGGVITLIKAVP